jgi:hypothetical protein
MKRLFHYTRASHLQDILEDKAIRPSTIGLDHDEKPAVWCTFRQEWEPTATPAMKIAGGSRVLTFQELTQVDTPVRIEVDPVGVKLDWQTWRRLSGVKSGVARRLERSAQDKKSYSADWRMSFAPIEMRHWLCIELFVDGQWRAYEEANSVALPGRGGSK